MLNPFSTTHHLHHRRRHHHHHHHHHHQDHLVYLSSLINAASLPRLKGYQGVKLDAVDICTEEGSTPH